MVCDFLLIRQLFGIKNFIICLTLMQSYHFSNQFTVLYIITKLFSSFFNFFFYDFAFTMLLIICNVPFFFLVTILCNVSSIDLFY